MRRTLMPGLIALVASTIFVNAATLAQPFRKLEFSRIGPWEVASIGNDEKVNHCALTRGTSSADLKPGEPKFLMIVDTKWMILRLRAAEYKFTEKKALAVTAITAEGVESNLLAATGGPDLADIRFSADRKDVDALLATRHLDIRTEDATVRLSFAGLAAAKADFDKCLANIGAPAKGWSNREVDELISQVKRGKAKCTTRNNVTMCDVDWGDARSDRVAGRMHPGGRVGADQAEPAEDGRAVGNRAMGARHDGHALHADPRQEAGERPGSVNATTSA